MILLKISILILKYFLTWYCFQIYNFINFLNFNYSNCSLNMIVTVLNYYINQCDHLFPHYFLIYLKHLTFILLLLLISYMVMILIDLSFFLLDLIDFDKIIINNWIIMIWIISMCLSFFFLNFSNF